MSGRCGQLNEHVMAKNKSIDNKRMGHAKGGRKYNEGSLRYELPSQPGGSWHGPPARGCPAQSPCQSARLASARNPKSPAGLWRLRHHMRAGHLMTVGKLDMFYASEHLKCSMWLYVTPHSGITVSRQTPKTHHKAVMAQSIKHLLLNTCYTPGSC